MKDRILFLVLEQVFTMFFTTKIKEIYIYPCWVKMYISPHHWHPVNGRKSQLVLVMRETIGVNLSLSV